MSRVLLTGATGFVGGQLYGALVAAGHEVICASRNPDRAAARLPGRQWVQLDVQRADQLRHALRGVDIVYYLVHAMAGGPGYHARERSAARNLAEAAASAGVQRIVYLGGVAPTGQVSQHLSSRIETGRILCAGPVDCIELRAGMIIGPGSASWKICRDLAARLPFMILPRWMSSRSEPIDVRDVVQALVAAARVPCAGGSSYDLPGPEVLKASEILVRIARIMGTRPLTVRVPLLTPGLSSYWLRLVSGAEFSIARELVQGLTSDLVATRQSFWTLLGREPIGFDEAVRSALAAEEPLSLRSRLLESAARTLSRAA